MEKLYYWTGRIVIDGAVVFIALFVFYFLAGAVGALYDAALRRYRWLNYRHYFLIKLFKTFVLQKDWLRKGSPQELEGWLRKHNDHRDLDALLLRHEAPFYRWLYAYIIRHNRRKWAESWA